MDMAGHPNWPAAKAIGHKHRLIASERIAHPFQMLPFPHNRPIFFFGSSGYPLRIEAGLAWSLILLLMAVQEN
jgi:hypothetical protein